MRSIRIRRHAALLVALLAVGALPGIARAQGWVEPTHRWSANGSVERVRSDVTIEVDPDGRIAHVTVEEVFRNAGPVVLEGDYLYPIPNEAVFTRFSLFMGERELVGEVLPADRARGIYEEIVRRRKDPALIELVGHGVLRARVFPVQPGQERRVILRYDQVLRRDGDLLRLVYPRHVGALWDERPVERGTRRQRPAADRFSLRIRIRNADGLATPYSPTHTIEVRDRDEGLEIVLDDADASPRDFELFLPLRDAGIGAGVVTHALSGEPGFFMLMITPPAAEREITIPRDVTLILDTSGSMSGGKIAQARDALDQILGSLTGDDRFRLITFNSVVREFRQGFADADPGTVRAAREFLAGVRADGSTNVADALRTALEPEATEDRLSLIVFLTDGKPTVGETSPEAIAEMARRIRDRERVFAFGVGHDVNTYLLDRLSESGRGTVSYVQPGASVEGAVAGLWRKIGHPALSDLRIVEAPVGLEDSYPNPLPDLFYGEELILFGRYRGHGSGELVLEGRRAGRSHRFTFDGVEFPERESSGGFIPKLWAARKAGALTAQIRLHGPDPELVEEIRELGLRYGIVTEYTSYLVEEPELTLGRRMEEVAMDRARRLASAPEAQAGRAAFDRAAASAQLREAKQVAESEIAVTPTTFSENPVGPRPRARHVGRKLFVHRDGAWTDVEMTSSLKTIEVAPYGDAYFELLRRLPGLAPYFALGDRVVIAGDGVGLELTPEGPAEIDPDDFERVVRGLSDSI